MVPYPPSVQPQNTQLILCFFYLSAVLNRGYEDDGALSMSMSMSQPWDDSLPFRRDEFVRVISSCLKGLGYG